MTTTYVRIRKFEIRVVELANFYKKDNKLLNRKSTHKIELFGLLSYHFVFLFQCNRRACYDRTHPHQKTTTSMSCYIFGVEQFLVQYHI